MVCYEDKDTNIKLHWFQNELVRALKSGLLFNTSVKRFSV